MILGAQSLVWFAVAGGAAVFGLSLVWSRFVRRDPQAVRSGGAYALFAACMLLVAIGAVVAGVVTASPGR